MVVVEARRQLWRMMKLGIPVGFDSMRGKPVPRADVSAIRAVTKRQPRQYMNRREGLDPRHEPRERSLETSRVIRHYTRLQ